MTPEEQERIDAIAKKKLLMVLTDPETIEDFLAEMDKDNG